MKLKFEKKQPSKNNKVFLEIVYCGGDADYFNSEFYLIHDTHFNDNESFVITANLIKEYEIFSTLQDILSEDELDYDGVLEKHGKELASMFEDVPGDQVYLDNLCRIDSINVIAYDTDGNKYKSYIY